MALEAEKKLNWRQTKRSWEHTVWIFPWTVAVTEKWKNPEDLAKLRDGSPAELGVALRAAGTASLGSALLEILYHGNQRKAAEVARAAAYKDEMIAKCIKDVFGETEARKLLTYPLDNLIEKPAENPRGFEIVYVQ
jgi:hypothetical protein